MYLPSSATMFFLTHSLYNAGVYLVMLLVSSAAAEITKFSYNYSGAIQNARVKVVSAIPL